MYHGAGNTRKDESYTLDIILTSELCCGMGHEEVAAMKEQKLTLTVEEAGQLLGISRGTAYLAVSDGTIPTIRLATRLVVPRAALMNMLENAAQSAARTKPPKAA